MLTISFLLILFAALSGSAMMVGIFGYFFFKIKKLEAGGDDLSRVLENIEDLRERLDATDDNVTSLSERLEFNERLLEGRSGTEEKPSD